jgi:hypothetical protein
MLRTVRVAGRLVELAGLQQVWLGVDHLSNSRITLYYPNGPTKTIDYAYGEYAQAEKDLKILEDTLRPLDLKVPCKPPHSDPTLGERLG